MPKLAKTGSPAVFRLLIEILVSVLALLALLGVVEYFPRPIYSSLVHSVYDTGHILVFGLFVVVLLYLLARLRWPARISRQYLLAIVLSMVVGGALEIWQGMHERSAEWIDMFSDGVGTIAFALTFAAFDPRLAALRKKRQSRTRLLVAALVLLLVGCIPLGRMVHRYWVRARIVPQLVTYVPSWYQIFYYSLYGRITVGPPPPGWPAKEGTVARVDLRPGDYPGFGLREPYPDWRGYRQLEMEVYLDRDRPKHFLLRIHDVLHDESVPDRFRKVFKLVPGPQVLTVDLEDVRRGARTRHLDLQRIAGLYLFTWEIEDQVTIYVGDIRLVR